MIISPSVMKTPPSSPRHGVYSCPHMVPRRVDGTLIDMVIYDLDIIIPNYYDMSNRFSITVLSFSLTKKYTYLRMRAAEK